MFHRPLRYGFLTVLSAGFMAGGWSLSRVSVLLTLVLGPIAIFALIMAAKLLRLTALNRTPQEVIAILQSFVEAPHSGYDPRWDDFVSVPIQDPKLDAVRRRLLQLESSYSRTPSDDFLRAWKQALREALRELGGAAA